MTDRALDAGDTGTTHGLDDLDELVDAATSAAPRGHDDAVHTDASDVTASNATVFPRRVIPEEPPPELRYRRALELGRALSGLWRARLTIWALVVRQVRSQYSQQFLGVSWAIIGPFAQTVLFTVLLSHTGKKSVINTAGVPTPLFLYVSLVVWSFYSSAVSTGGTSLVGNSLLNKVYAPREVFPLSQIASSAINALAAILVLPLLYAKYERAPSLTMYWVPVLLVILSLFTIAITLIVSATTVYLRDTRSGLPLIMQMGMFMPGVLYPLSTHTWSVPYAAFFPIAAVNDGLRTVLFHNSAPAADVTLAAAGGSVVYLIIGFMFFKRLETGFADVG